MAFAPRKKAVPPAPAPHPDVVAERVHKELQATSPEVINDSNVLRTCSFCGTLHALKRGAELEQVLCKHCGKTLSGNRDRLEQRLPPSLFDKDTGMRKRWRERLGFKHAMPTMEPDTEAGARLADGRHDEGHGASGQPARGRALSADGLSRAKLTVFLVVMIALAAGIFYLLKTSE